MKKLNKILSLIAIIAILVVSLSVFISCTEADPEPVKEDATFDLVVRQYNGYDDQSFTANTDGTVLATLKVTIKAGQVYVSDALAAIATKEGDDLKVSLNDTDYLLFYSSWWLKDGHFNAEPNYIADDFSNSYVDIDGVMSNGPTKDSLQGIKVYTIVIDGYDGNTGVAKVWA